MLNLLHDKDDLDAIGRSLSMQNSVINCCVEVLPVVRPVAVLLPHQNLLTPWQMTQEHVCQILRH